MEVFFFSSCVHMSDPVCQTIGFLNQQDHSGYLELFGKGSPKQGEPAFGFCGTSFQSIWDLLELSLHLNQGLKHSRLIQLS